MAGLSIEVDSMEGGLYVEPLPIRGTDFPELWDEGVVNNIVQRMKRPVAVDLGEVDGYIRITVDYMGHPKGFFNPAAGSEPTEPPIASQTAVVRIQVD